MQPELEQKRPQPEPEEDKGRGRSTIEFPYLDLNNSIEIVQNVRNVGGTGCEWRQLAAKMDVSPDGGSFRMRVMTAKLFGLLTYDRGNIELTNLGIEILEPAQERKSRVEAFQRVALYKALFDKLNGQVLPPPAAVERMIETLGVAPKQKDKARQAFMRSAKQAGLFELSPDRLTLPPGLNGNNREQGNEEEKNSKKGQGQGLEQVADEYHPFIVGLLRTLPPTDTEWTMAARVKWLQAASNIFGLIYTTKEDDEVAMIEITKKVL